MHGQLEHILTINTIIRSLIVVVREVGWGNLELIVSTTTSEMNIYRTLQYITFKKNCDTNIERQSF